MTAPRQAASATVLLAEDESALRDLVTTVLEMGGYQVLPARDGAHALQIASAYPGEIHLLLSDVMMPKLTGPELARQLAATRSGMRVVMMSGQMPPSVKMDKNWTFLNKPMRPTELLNHVSAILTGSSQSRSALA